MVAPDHARHFLRRILFYVKLNLKKNDIRGGDSRGPSEVENLTEFDGFDGFDGGPGGPPKFDGI